jgi:hypothetical protein
MILLFFRRIEREFIELLSCLFGFFCCCCCFLVLQLPDLYFMFLRVRVEQLCFVLGGIEV